MMYLLDVNALIALGYPRHVHHERVRAWLRELHRAKDHVVLATCAITELGFIRVSSGPATLAKDVSSAQMDLKRLKADGIFNFLDDVLSAEQMPDWVRLSKQTTDGHLFELATHHGARLATLDAGIRNAELIPDNVDPNWMVREEPARYGVAA